MDRRVNSQSEDIHAYNANKSIPQDSYGELKNSLYLFLSHITSKRLFLVISIN